MTNATDHQKYVAAVYDRAAEAYDDAGGGTFTKCAEILVAHAGLGEAEAVLDVATGTGAVPVALAHGSARRIVGVDTSAGMLAQARSRLVHRDDVQFVRMSAADLALADDSFQAVLCSQALPFFPDRLQALREFRRVTTPGGRVVVGVRGLPDPSWSFLSRLVDEFGATAPILGDPFCTPDWSSELRSDLLRAGFRDISAHTDSFVVSFGSFDEVWAHLWASGFRASLERMAPDRLEAFRERARSTLEFLSGPSLRVQVITALGTRAHRQRLSSPERVPFLAVPPRAVLDRVAERE